MHAKKTYRTKDLLSVQLSEGTNDTDILNLQGNIDVSEIQGINTNSNSKKILQIVRDRQYRGPCDIW